MWVTGKGTKVQYLKILSTFFYGTHSMSEVLLGGLTNTAQDFKVIQTEEFKNFLMCTAFKIHCHCFFPCTTGPSSRCGSPVPVLLQEGVGHILQSQADCGLSQRALPPADGTFTPGLLLVPELLKTGPAETVAALEHYRLLEDFTAYRTGELIFQHGAWLWRNSSRSQGRI